MHVDTVNTTVRNIVQLMIQMSTLLIQTILVNLTILSLNLMKYTHWNCHCSCSLLHQQPEAANESTREISFVASATVLKQTSLIGVTALGSFEGVGALGVLLK